MGLIIALIRACYGGLLGILSGFTKSTGHPSRMSAMPFCFDMVDNDLI